MANMIGYLKKSHMPYFLRLLTVFLICFTLTTKVDSAPQIRNGALIRDAEIEETLKIMMRPLFKAAGLKSDNLRLFVVASPEINAAASINFSVFINTGLITKAKNVGQLIGVLAHETGHIAGSHIVRTQDVLRKSSLLAMATTALGVAAMLAGSGDAGMGLIHGGQAMAQGNYLHYSRGQEAAADQAALRILSNLHWPVIGLKEFFDYLAKQEYYSTDRRDAYLYTHPLSSERINLIDNFLSKHNDASLIFPSDFDQLFDRIVAKIFAYTNTPFTTFLKYPQSRADFSARYARAIAYYRNNQSQQAIDMLDDLTKAHPNDAFIHELKGQIFFELGQLQTAITHYQQAHQLLPASGLIHLGLLQIESALESKSSQTIINELKQIKLNEQENPQLWHLMAVAYSRMHDEGRAAYALAEKALYQDDTDQAYKQIKRALHFLKSGPEIIAAQDLLNELKLMPDSQD